MLTISQHSFERTITFEETNEILRLKVVAKILALYFLLGSFFPNTDFSQMTKMLNLLEHFNEHKEETSKDGEPFSLIKFLDQHYTQANDHQHNNGHSHQKLPLHQFGGFTADFVAQTIPYISSFEFEIGSALLAGIHQWNSYEFIQPVFQPPVSI